MRRIMNQRGETIVEVLIAIAVIGSVLGSAYAIVSRNTKSYQQASEHTEALKIAESQLEYLRKSPQNGSSFCFNNSGTVQGAPCPFGPDGRYEVTVTRDSTTNTFTSAVEWDGINGGTDRVSLSYRAY